MPFFFLWLVVDHMTLTQFTPPVAFLYFIGLATSRLGFLLWQSVCDSTICIFSFFLFLKWTIWILFYLLFKVSIFHVFEGTAGAFIFVPELNFKAVCNLYCSSFFLFSFFFVGYYFCLFILNPQLLTRDYTIYNYQQHHLGILPSTKIAMIWHHCRYLVL